MAFKAFKYRGRDEKDIKERASQQGGAYDNFTKSGIPRYKVKNGENNIRILPPTWKDVDTWGKGWGIVVYVHYGIGTDNSTYLCLNKMKEEECPICVARDEAPPVEEGEQDELKPGKRILCYVIDRDDEKAGPQMWAMPWTVERDISALSIDKKLGALLIDDPEEGYDVTFSRDGKGRTVKYVGMKIARDASPIHDKEKTQDEWLEYISENPLPDILHYYDAEYIAKVYGGKMRRKEDDEAETEEKTPKTTRRGGRKDEPEEDEPERASSKKKPAKGVAAADVEEMEEDDLLKVIKTYDLDVDPDDFPRLSKLKAAVLEELKEKKLLESEEEDPEPEKSSRPSRSAPKRGESEESGDPTDDLVNEDDLADMGERDLLKLIKKHDLDVDPDDYPRESKLREAVAEALETADLLAKKKSSTEKAKEAIAGLKKNSKKEADDEETEEDEKDKRRTRDRDTGEKSKSREDDRGAKSRSSRASEDEETEDEPRRRPSRR